jgi:hypothetical protein
MAKNNAHDEFVKRLRAHGLRRKVAENLADGLANARGGKPPAAVAGVIDNLKALTAELEDRATGGPAKRKAAAEKAAATRRRKAAQRSTAAKKAARTRARSAA